MDECTLKFQIFDTGYMESTFDTWYVDFRYKNIDSSFFIILSWSLHFSTPDQSILI